MDKTIYPCAEKSTREKDNVHCTFAKEKDYDLLNDLPGRFLHVVNRF